MSRERIVIRNIPQQANGIAFCTQLCATKLGKAGKRELVTSSNAILHLPNDFVVKGITVAMRTAQPNAL
jgi:hypothetical protein